MKIKILYGALDKDKTDLVTDLIEKSPKPLEGINLGSKVTRASLKRYLTDSTVSVVLLNESDYDKMLTSLSDDRLVSVINDYTIRNLFEHKYGVVDLDGEGDSDEGEENSNEGEENSNEGGVEPIMIETKDSVDSEEVAPTDQSELTWDEILAQYNELGVTGEDDSDFGDEVEDFEFQTSETFITEENDKESQKDLLSIPSEVGEADGQNTSSNVERALRQTIDNLRLQIEEQKSFLDESVSKEDYNSLKDKHANLIDQYNQLENEHEMVLNELDDIKIKFKDLLIKYTDQVKLSKVAKSNENLVKPLEGQYPNIELIVPLSSGSVFKMYEYIAQRKDSFLFLDLTHNSYIDNFIKFEEVIKPTKWLIGDWSYNRVQARNKTNTNIKVISHVVHELDRGSLTRINWDKVFGELATENKVVISLGGIQDEFVKTFINTFKGKLTIKGFVGDLQRDHRIAKFSLNGVALDGVITGEHAKDSFGIITERY